MRKVLKYFKAAGIVWTVLLCLPSLCHVGAHPSKDIYPHPLTSSFTSQNISTLESQNVSKLELIQPSPSTLHKIIHQHDFHAHPSKSGASNLHKIIQRLGYFKMRKENQIILNNNNNNNNNNTTKNNTLGNNSSSISMIDNANRLKRQLEGIFHVRGNASPTSTIIPILPSKSTKSPHQIIRHDRNPSINSTHGGGPIRSSNNKIKTAKKETRTEVKDISTTSTAKTLDTPQETNIPPAAIKDKRNFTVEIVEISRKTIIKQDGQEEPPPDRKIKVIDSKASLQKENFLKPTPPLYKVVRPRLRLTRFRQPPTQIKILDDSQNVESKSKQNTNHDESEAVKPIRDNKRQSPQNSPKVSPTPPPVEKSVEVQVSYQDKIPYNDRDIDESDLKDYLEGHSTFGAKGDFKHTVTRNVTGFIPNNSPRRGHEVHKRTPQPPTAGSDHSPARSRSRGINIEQANVRQMAKNPRTTVYTASGVNYNPKQEDDDTESVFQYTGNKDKVRNKIPNPPKPSSAFDELYRQGHPAVLKAPQPIYKSHSLGEPYGTRPEDDYQENPFRHNPLTDDPPLKFDPESDRFYGEPTPDKDKKLAQSNRPEPVRVENQAPEYQEVERTTSRPGNNYNSNSNNNDDRYYYQPSSNDDDYNNYGATEGDPGADHFIRDFVSLDNNFEKLPRPSREDESFRSLVPAEVDEDGDSRYFTEPERNRGDYNNRGNNNRGSTTTARSPDSHGTRSSPPPRRQSNEDYDDGYDFNPAENSEGPDTEDFDPSYVDALKHFDEEIKKIEENERKGITTGNPVTTTNDLPLVITSPGPAVAYPTGGSAQRPTTATTPRDQEEENGDEEEEPEDEQTQRPDDRSQEDEGKTEKSAETDGNSNDDEEEEETEEPPSEESDESTTSKSEEDNDNDAKGKDAEESRYKRQQVEIQKLKMKNDSTSEKPKEDKSGNLDEDISAIEKEYGHLG